MNNNDNKEKKEKESVTALCSINHFGLHHSSLPKYNNKIDKHLFEMDTTKFILWFNLNGYKQQQQQNTFFNII